MVGTEVCSHVKVVVRVRPFNSRENEGTLKKVVHVVDDHMLIFDPKEEEVTFFRGQRMANRDIRKKVSKDLKFVFDNVFGENSTQMEVFENTTKGIVDGVLNGYNCTVFAYGATGAGKTHTMLGTTENPGVMYLTMKELFTRMELITDEKVFDVAFSYLEVYNEQIRDLLVDSGPLAVREDGSKGVVVQGLSLHQPRSAEHILEALDYGNRNRTQHPTDMNASSSRSHAVFQIYLRQQEKTATLNPNVRVAKMSLIDLAGSERASSTNAKGARLREGANINRSLLALGNVINTLADPKTKKTHIPYRDSKLTRLLKDSLGGNCRTVMIANVSPSPLSYEDTHNTLKYANRAKEIKSTLKSNVVSLDSHIGQYAVICEKQRAEIVLLKEKLRAYEERKVGAPAALNPVPAEKRAQFEKMSERLRGVFAARLQARREQLDSEKQLKESELKLRYREAWHRQGQLFFPQDKAEKATCKYERKLASLQAHRLLLQQRLTEGERRLVENEGLLHRLENDMKLLGADGHPPEALQQELRCQQLQLRVADLQQQMQHRAHLIGLQDQENEHTQKLVNALLPVCRQQRLALKATGIAVATDDTAWLELEHLVQRERGVVWADQEQAGEKDETEGCTDGARLRPILMFSHLATHQNTPCSAEKHTRRVSQCRRPTLSSRGPGPQDEVTAAVEPTVKKPTRRKLVVSPPKPSHEGPPLVHCSQGLQETLRQEGMFPLHYTPEGYPKPNASTTFDPNVTFDIGHGEEEQTPADATVVVSEGSPQPAAPSQAVNQIQALRANNHMEPPKRLEIPSLLDIRRAKPSYMSMTSAAQGKRKLNCIKDETDGSQGVAAPKRIKQDPKVTTKPLRIRRLEASSENEPVRRVVRSVSEGNLHLIDARKSKPGFLRGSLFKRVSKRV